MLQKVLPKRLYIPERIENRDVIIQHGIPGWVSMFCSPEEALQVVSPPCDVYVIRTGRLKRKLFEERVDPIPLFQYNGDVSLNQILFKITYR